MSYVRDKQSLKTGYQESRPWSKMIDLQCDFVMVYGFSDDLEDRIKGFKDKGYVIQFMTGISWGEYQDYLNGSFDGLNHWNDAQMDEHGNYIIHGTSEDIPYMVPTHAYINYIYRKLTKVVDLGVTAIHLEEPEFWSHAGYSKSFKEAYEVYYKEAWVDPKSDLHAMYKSQMLKAKLYLRALNEIAERIKMYAKKTYGTYLPVYVPTHSLVNYSQWKIMSPESQLIGLSSIDGFIAQVWTGTSREPNVFKGIKKERTFETALLEYSMMTSFMGKNQRVWFLNDPIEDNPNYTWDNYKFNYEKTLISSLLNKTINDYEICPWPHRIFERKLPVDSKNSTLISLNYDRYLNQVFQMLGDMPKDEEIKTNELRVALLMSDTAMYQRESKDEKDLTFSNFYGLALPLVKRGVFVEFRTIEKMMVDKLSNNTFDILVMSYDFLKPMSVSFHYVLLSLIEMGKTVLFVGSNKDYYSSIYPLFGFDEHPFDHLKKLIGSEVSDQKIIKHGKGYFAYLDLSPSEIALNEEKHDGYLKFIDELYQIKGSSLPDKNYFHAKRGPYEIVSVMDETNSNEPFHQKGLYADMTTQAFDIVNEMHVEVDHIGLYYDLSSAKHGDIIGTTFRILSKDIQDNKITLSLSGREDLQGFIRIYVDRKPKTVSKSYLYDETSKTVLIELTLNKQEEIITITY